MRKPAVAMDGVAYEEAALTAYVEAATKGAARSHESTSVGLID
jgi:hypothetical protein